MNKRILVTGASSGIGRATAIEMSKRGHSVVLAARREDRLAQVAAECLAAGAIAAIPVPCDLADPDHIERAALALGELPDELEPCLFNNAGFAEFAPVASTEPAQLASMISVNLTGAMLMARAVLPLMLGMKQGRIISVLSITAEVTFPNSAAYSAAKAGLRQFGRCLQSEVRRQGIFVTNVLPGAINTEIWDKSGGGPKREDMIPEQAVAETMAWLFELPGDRSVDEMTLMPPKGIL